MMLDEIWGNESCRLLRLVKVEYGVRFEVIKIYGNRKPRCLVSITISLPRLKRIVEALNKVIKENL